MIGDEDNINDLDDEDGVDEDDDDLDDDEDAELSDIGGDTVVGLSGEYDIDSLFKKLDSTDPSEVSHRREIRRRIEEIRELREADLDSTFNFNLDDD